MFKGIKKRFNSSRSGRRKPDRSSPPADPQGNDTPDRKSASPRQVHPADLVVSAAPYARRSLERGVGGRRSPCKTPPSSSPAVQPPTVTSAYPTTPNLCVTGGKIEFITPPDSTLSSTASRSSTLKLSPCTQREDACPRSGHSPDHATPPSTLSRTSPSSTGSKDCKTYGVVVGGEGKEEEEGGRGSNVSPEVRPAPTNHHITQETSYTINRHNNINNNNNNNYNNTGSIMDSCQKGGEEHLVDNLRRENEEVKDRLAKLQQEFSLLERQVRTLASERRLVEEQQRAEAAAQEQAYMNKLQQYQATIAALDHCNTTLAHDPPLPLPLPSPTPSKVEERSPQQEDTNHSSNNSVVQMLADRCHTLEQANKRLQEEARTQQRQYELCLDRVATQVVQALLSQKSHQEQCIKLAHQVQDLRRQNAALSSLVGPVGMRQTLPCQYRHRCPPPPHPPSFFSLPTSLTKNRQQSEAWPPGGWVASWHVEESSRSHLGDHIPSPPRFHHSSLQMLSDASIPTSLSHAEHNTTTSSSVELGEDYYSPRDSHPTTTTTVTSTNTSTTTCWYDIVTSLSLNNSPQGASASGNQQLPLLSSRMSVGPPTWDQPDTTGAGTGRTSSSSSSSSSSSDSPLQSAYPQQDPFSTETGVGCLPDLGCKKTGEMNFLSPPPGSDSSTNKFSPLSLESAATSLTNSPEQKNCPVFQTKIDNLAFDESKMKVIQEENFNSPPREKNANIIVNNVTKDEILQVKERILKTLTETTVGNLQLDLSVLSCEDKNKPVLNKNLSKVCVRTGGGENNLSEEGVEGATKDEGYSTMSSDVQAEVKDSIATCSVTTVQEEPHPPATTPTQPQQQHGDSGDAERQGSSESVNKSLDRTVVKERKISSTANTEYCDGLRVIYDEEDNNSDVFFIPIQEPENSSLYRNSYQKPASTQKNRPVRCYSDSQLYVARKRAHGSKPLRSLDRHVSEKDISERSPSTEVVLEEATNTRSLKRSGAQASLKRSYNHAKEDHTTSGSSEALWPPEDHQRKYLSPTYSHAELEDWSLDLSSEYLSGVCGEGEGSESVATSGAHHGSLPSIQEATPDLEEDNNEFLWNGATYFKADLDLNWSSKKELTKSWQLDHCKENHTVISPRSGCSDQPAVWSSSEQLSCCSEGVSKCSSDFENFCEQICNLPELKRVSFCSSEAGCQEASKGALNDTSSMGEHEDELADEMCVDTVFTRDFYRLVKFESNKSLAASSKSLATSEGLLTIEKLQDLEAGGTHKEALASVLGFIAEQRKYCTDREAQDEKDISPSKNVLRLANALEASSSPLASAIFRGTFPKRSPRDGTSNSSNIMDDFSMRTLPSYNAGDSAKARAGPPVPAKLRPSPLQDTTRGTSFSNSIPARHPSATSPTSLPAVPPPTLPVLPPTSKPMPSVPSRSSSLASPQVTPAGEVEFPLSHVPKVPIRSVVPLPGTNSVAEEPSSCATLPPDTYDLPPPVPERNSRNLSSMPAVSGPPVPRRSSSMAFCNVLPVPEHKVNLTDSPPVPKRITSRALPTPPPVSPSQAMKPPTFNGSVRPQGGSLEGKRRTSFIKETLGLSSPRRPQSDYCELPSLSENPGGMLMQLQRMAQVEEEEEKKKRARPGGPTGPEAVSPGDTVGLGTGWVRVQPHIDLQDPQARANLLDGMMESSEGCSSETEEEEVANHQYHELRLMHRSRRKRKASHRSGGDRIVLAGAIPRPSVIGRRDLFTRYGEKEKEALEEFSFLGDFSTSHSDLGSQDLLGSAPLGGATLTCTTTTTTTITTTTSSTSVPVLPLSTNNAGAVLPKVDSDSRKKHFRRSDARALRKDYNRPSPGVSWCQTDEQGGVDTRSICSVKSTVRQLNKMNHISGMKEPATVPISPARSASSTSSNRAHVQKYSSPASTNLPKHTPAKSKGSEGGVSGVLRCSARQGNAPSSRTPSPQLNAKDNKGVSHKARTSLQLDEKSQSDNTKTSSPTRIPRIQTSVMSSKGSKADSPKLQKDAFVRDSNCESMKKGKQQSEKALPPKGFSSRVVKQPTPRTRPSLQQRPLSHQPPTKAGIRSPRLARLKKNSDPLDFFSNKSLCDSGSSEGSERCGGRLSLSDSCAENFSPIDSGDEVFHKES